MTGFIDTSPTLENLEKSLKSILELMANPYCGQFMFLSLIEKRDKTIAKIEKLKL